MKPISSNRKFQVWWGIFMIVAMLGCNLSSAGTPKPNAAPGGKDAPVEQASGNQPAGGTGNDNKLEMRPTDAPAAPSAPAWQPQLSAPVLTKPLTAGQAQTVDVEGKMTLNFPAGAFTETPPQLVVSPVTGDIPVPLPGDVALQAYEVSLGDLHNLAEPLQVSMRYDPAKLKPDIPADAQLGAALWDKASGKWFGLSTTIDETAHTVNFETDHLSLLAVYLETELNDYCKTTHFYIAYDKANIATGAGAMNYTSKGTTCSTLSGGKSTPPDFVAAVADNMEAAYQGYNASNISIAPPQGGSIVVLAAYIQGNLLWGSESQYDTPTGRLIISTDSWPNANELRQDCAHELFHLWQYKHTGLGQYIRNEAWMDATADYAADKVAYTGTSFGPTNSMGKDIRGKFLEGSLTSTTDFHAYSSAHFVDFLVNQSGYFPTLLDLWNASMTSILSSPLENLKTWLKTNMNTDFADTYTDFANYMLFDPASKLPIKSPVWDSNAKNDSMNYAENMGEVPATAEVARYASILWGLRVDKARFMSITWTNPNDGQVRVSIDENGDERGGSRAMYHLYGHEPSMFLMRPETTVYILMVNPTPDSLEFDLKINGSQAEAYSVGIEYDKTDATCRENAAWGTPTSVMEVAKDNKVTIHYDSSTDDYYWSEHAEHTMKAAGAGKLTGDKLEAGFQSTDVIKLGADAKGTPVTGTVNLDVSFVVTRRPDNPFYWDAVSVKGTANVDLPATANKPAYSCSAAVKSVFIQPALVFPLHW